MPSPRPSEPSHARAPEASGTAVAQWLARLKLAWLRPPIRRVLALDAGSNCFKLVLIESRFGKLRLLREEILDLQAEGLVSADETKVHLQTLLEDWGHPPLALILPQHVSISQLLDLPAAEPSQMEKVIQDEIVKLSGVSERRMVYDFVRGQAPARGRQQFWVTLCAESEIRDRILRLGVEQEDLCEITTTANALMMAYRACVPASSRAILVHIGAQTTVVAILAGGQSTFATSFQMGGDFFTRSLARILHCPEETAEARRRERNLFAGEDALPDFVAVVEGWAGELKRQLNDWFEHNPALAAEVESFELIASGGGFDQPGLMEYLATESGVALKPWPKPASAAAIGPSKRFEVAFGAALQALDASVQPVSLLPKTFRVNWERRLSRQRIEMASVVLAVVCLLALVLGTWHSLTLVFHRQALLNKVQAGLEAVQTNQVLLGELAFEHETFRPLFARQQNTLDTLKTMALLQQCRSNREFWFVLLADQQSYFSQPPISSTNKLGRTNVLVTVPERPRLPVPEVSGTATTGTNGSLAKPGFIAELCVPEEPEAARRTLSQVVNSLKPQPIFSRVDLLSDDLRRGMADPKVLVPDRHFVLALDFAVTDFQQPLPIKRSAAAQRGLGKRPSRARPVSETSDKNEIPP